MTERADEKMFGSADLAGQYGARVAQDIGSDPDYDPVSETVVVVVDDSGTEIARHRVEERRSDGGEPSSGREEGLWRGGSGPV